MSIWGYLPVAFVMAVVWMHSIAFAQTQAGAPLKLDTGEEIFKAACIGCHGPNGKGQPESTLGFQKPDTFPDFSDCRGTTGEKNSTGGQPSTKAAPVAAFPVSCRPFPRL